MVVGVLRLDDAEVDLDVLAVNDVEKLVDVDVDKLVDIEVE